MGAVTQPKPESPKLKLILKERKRSWGLEHRIDVLARPSAGVTRNLGSLQSLSIRV